MVFVLTIAIAAAPAADGATLTITPDKTTYAVGEIITLNVFGDAQGAIASAIFGSILFDAERAEYVDASQTALTTFGGFLVWTTGSLIGGAGFATAFNQVGGPPLTPDGPLTANVRLRATATGTLSFLWDASTFDFFGLTIAPGGSVTIVPEPSTGSFLAIGFLVLATIRRSRRQ